jgi:chromosome segregation ATPase
MDHKELLNIIPKINDKIKVLQNNQDIDSTTEIYLLERLRNNFILLNNYREKIIQSIPYFQKQISTTWDLIIDKKADIDVGNKKLQNLNREARNLQNIEMQLQKKKTILYKNLKKDDNLLNKDQSRFNKNGEILDKLKLKLDIVTLIDSDSNDVFLNRLFGIRNKLQAKRLHKIIAERHKTSSNLSEQIQTYQDKIDSTTEKIQLEQQKLKNLQIENIKIRFEIQRLIDNITENKRDLQQSEGQIQEYNETLKLLSSSLVEIANKNSQQHSFYKKVTQTQNESDFEKMVRQIMPIDQALEFENLEDIFLNTPNLDQEIEIID